MDPSAVVKRHDWENSSPAWDAGAETGGRRLNKVNGGGGGSGCCLHDSVSPEGEVKVHLGWDGVLNRCQT